MVGASDIERNKFKKQALVDWEAILSARAKELEPGGRFICINFGIDEVSNPRLISERIWRSKIPKNSIYHGITPVTRNYE